MRNKTWRSVFSVLLAAALLLPMAPAVRADALSGEAAKVAGDYSSESDVTVAATGITLSPAGGTVYYRDGYAGKITVTAVVSPSNYSGKVKWTLETGGGLVSLSAAETDVSLGKAEATLTTMGTGEGSVNLKGAAGGHSATITITVAKDTVKPSTVAFSNTALSVRVGESAKVSLKDTPEYLSGGKAASVTYVSSNTAVATVDANGSVQGVKVGTATISARVDGAAVPGGGTVTVTVAPPTPELTGSATLGSNFSLRSFHTSLNTQFSSAYGHGPTKISFSDLGTAGTLTDKDGRAVVSGTQYAFSELLDMYLKTASAGKFECKYTVKDDTAANAISGTVTITISVPNYPVRIPIDGSANYSFDQAGSGGKTGAQMIGETLGTFGSIKFGAVSTASGNVGTLYTGNPPSNDNRVENGTVVSSSAVNKLYFTPSRAGTYTISFTAYSNSDGTGAVICTGSLILPVDAASLDLSFSLSSVAPYTFSNAPGSGTDSLASQLRDVINGAVGSSLWGGIKFDGAASAPSTGTLYPNSSSRAISTSDYISKTNISYLYYVPERSGTYEITYGVYENENSTKVIATGKLTIYAAAIPAGASDITYTTTAKSTVTLSESDFINFFQKKNSSKYHLAYVIFNEYDGNGTFYHGSSSFLPYNSSDYYTSTYTGSMPTNARYLDRLTFTAPSDTGYTAVLFTCYGGTATNSATTVTTGKLCIFYSADSVPVVSYNISGGTSADLKEADFAAAYNAAMKTSLSKPSFTIQLLTVPSKGTLYHYYSGNNRRALTSSNFANYTFAVNDTSRSSVDELTYIPDRNESGTDEITYLVSSSGGAVLYIGTIQFKFGSDLTLYVTNDGSNFQLTDFYDASDSDPILYVTFPQPSAGKVYVYAGDRYVAASAATKLYTVSASNGDYPITSAFYAPRANETGAVSIQCVAHRKSGATNNNTITLNILSKSSSTTFGDVGGVTSWAANSIDFARKMGLVNGTQLNPPLFSPSNTMRRSDFVLMLYRLAGSPAVVGSSPYADVTSDKYYYDSVVWAYGNNIMRNVTFNNLYDPEGALTRQDFAQILFNYTRAMGGNTASNVSLLSYSDASSVSANTLEGVMWAVANGYITSAVVGALYIEPTRAATRAEISTLLHRYLTY